MFTELHHAIDLYNSGELTPPSPPPPSTTIAAPQPHIDVHTRALKPPSHDDNTRPEQQPTAQQELAIPDTDDCRAWLKAPLVTLYLTAAAAGTLRTRTNNPTNPRPSAHSTTRTRIQTLRELGRRDPTLKPDDLVPRTGTAPPVQGTSRADQARKLLSWLRNDHTEQGIRTYAVAALASAGVQASEAAALKLSGVTMNFNLTPLLRNPPGPGEPYLVEIDLPDHARTAIKNWAGTREVIAPDHVDHFFVTLAPTHLAGARYPRGMPTTTRGLVRAHRAAVEDYLANINPTLEPDNRIAPSELTLRRLLL